MLGPESVGEICCTESGNAALSVRGWVETLRPGGYATTAPFGLEGGGGKLMEQKLILLRCKQIHSDCFARTAAAFGNRMAGLCVAADPERVLRIPVAVWNGCAGMLVGGLGGCGFIGVTGQRCKSLEGRGCFDPNCREAKVVGHAVLLLTSFFVLRNASQGCCRINQRFAIVIGGCDGRPMIAYELDVSGGFDITCNGAEELKGDVHMDIHVGILPCPIEEASTLRELVPDHPCLFILVAENEFELVAGLRDITGCCGGIGGDEAIAGE